MTVVRRLLVLLAFTVLPAVGSAFASAPNIYITQSGSASGNCTANVQTPAFFNSSANWGSGASQIGPGTTVLICGTFTGSGGATEFTFHGSGVNGNPVVLKFDTGAQLTAPFWSANGAINCSNLSYIVVDGGTNGIIQNTANGTSLANHQTSTGFFGSNCTNSEVKNLTISNIYINQGSSSNASDTGGASTTDIVFNGNATNSKVDHNTVSQAKTGIQFAGDPGGDASNIQIYSNSISDMDWGVNVGGGDSGDTFNNVSIYDNTITNWTNWQFPTGAFHQDGIILFNVGNPSAGISANIYDNYIYGNLGVGSPTGFIYCADFSSCTIYNNSLVNTSNVIYGLMWLGQSSNMGHNMNVYNNTIVGATSRDVCIMLNITGKANIENNVCTGPSGMFAYSTYWGSLSQFEATVTTSNFNDWNIGSNAWGSQATGSTASYSTWTSAGYDANSKQSNPELNSTPYTLQSGSPAIGLGTNLTSLGLSALDTGAPQTFGAGGSCGNGCLTRAGSGSWDAGAYPFSSSSVGTSSPPAPPTDLSAIVQ
ncbi:MAG TPA: hypothetical protein VEI52_08140 [Terriglobales bacterium]|nr:hypothetical protein [Terriglobales bacterium]